MRGVILWLIGVPISIIILLYLFNVLFTRLMQDLYALIVLQVPGCLLHGHVDGMSASASAEYENRELPGLEAELLQRLVHVSPVYAFSHERAVHSLCAGRSA